MDAACEESLTATMKIAASSAASPARAPRIPAAGTPSRAIPDAGVVTRSVTKTHPELAPSEIFGLDSHQKPRTIRNLTVGRKRSGNQQPFLLNDEIEDAPRRLVFDDKEAGDALDKILEGDTESKETILLGVTKETNAPHLSDESKADGDKENMDNGMTVDFDREGKVMLKIKVLLETESPTKASSQSDKAAATMEGSDDTMVKSSDATETATETATESAAGIKKPVVAVLTTSLWIVAAIVVIVSIAWQFKMEEAKDVPSPEPVSTPTEHWLVTIENPWRNVDEFFGL